MEDEEKLYDFETYLQDSKNYDIDYLAFYIKVLEFKDE